MLACIPEPRTLLALAAVRGHLASYVIGAGPARRGASSPQATGEAAARNANGYKREQHRGAVASPHIGLNERFAFKGAATVLVRAPAPAV